MATDHDEPATTTVGEDTPTTPNATKARMGRLKARRQAAKLAADIGKRGIEDVCQHGEQEIEFHHTRRWKFDLAYMRARVAVELHGGGWKGGKHHRGIGARNDYEKSLAASLAGWVVVQLDYGMAGEQEFVNKLAELIRRRLELADRLEELGETL